MRISPRGYGPDIIEDHAGDGRRPHGVEQHSKEAATEGADEHRTIDLNCREHRNDVRKLDREAIIGGAWGRNPTGRGRANLLRLSSEAQQNPPPMSARARENPRCYGLGLASTRPAACWTGRPIISDVKPETILDCDDHRRPPVAVVHALFG